MTTKTKKPVAPEVGKFPRPRKTVPVRVGKTEEETFRSIAAAMTSPELAACRVISGAERKSVFWKDIDVPALMEQLREQSAAVNRGDLAQAEAMLMNQATALQSLFARLAEKAMGAEYLANLEAFMRMALRAQSQCRATLETLAAIKNPPIVYARQANIAHGPQQVNNGIPGPAQAEKVVGQSNELLEAQHGERLDTGTAGAATGLDPAMATVGEINRPANG